MLIFFFFSSRRRHTRWNCDWSSDVCSSDLTRPRLPELRAAGVYGVAAIRALWDAADPRRSEERRVGKECRSRWSPDHYKKKQMDTLIRQTQLDMLSAIRFDKQ